MKDKNVLVTGGAGFIGSHLVDKLAVSGVNKLCVIDNLSIGQRHNLEGAFKIKPDMVFFEDSASDFEFLKKVVEDNLIDYVFHLATLPLPLSHEKPALVTKEIIDMAVNIAELARQDKIKKVLSFSTSEVYGTAKQIPMTESHPKIPLTPYAAAKAGADHVFASYFHTFGIKVTTLRPFNNYGPRQNENNYAGVIPLTIKRILNGENPIIYGDGEQTRDFIFVKDTAEWTLKVFNEKSLEGKDINIAGGVETKIKDLIEMIADLMEYKGEISFAPKRAADVDRHLGGVELARKALDFKPKFGIEEGLKLTVDWYKEVLK